MAHVLKIKAPSVSPLVDHYERLRSGTFDRSNIDEARTHLNYNLAPSDVKEKVRLAMAKHEQTAGRAVRSDANVLFDWVVTLPKDCPEESAREFFSGVLEFIQGRYGADNVLGAYVHLDETTPHMHVPVLPMMKNKLQASKMINRNDLMRFHGELGKFIDGRLGFHVSVELDEEKHLEKAMSKLDQEEMKLAAKRLESLQRAEIEARARIGDLEKAIAAERDRVCVENYAREAIQNGTGTRAMANEIQEYKEATRRLERARDAVKERIGLIREQISGLRTRISEVAQGNISGLSQEFLCSMKHKIELKKLKTITRELEQKRPIQIRKEGWLER